MAHAHPGAAHPCLNCGTQLEGGWEYCPTCGQQNHDLKIPIGHLLYEVVEGIWHFDGKFFTTVRALATRPGQITADFLDGRRVRYVPPVRLYIFVAALFFIVLNQLTHKALHEADHHKSSVATKGRFPKSEDAHGPIIQFGSGVSNGLQDTAGDFRKFSRRAAKAKPSLPPELTIEALYSVYSNPDTVVAGKTAKAWMRSYDQLAERGLAINNAQTSEAKDMAMVARRAWFARLLYHTHTLPQGEDGDLLRAAMEVEAADDTIIFQPNASGFSAKRVEAMDFGVPADSLTVDMLLHGPGAKKDSIANLYHVPGFWERLTLNRQARIHELRLTGQDGTSAILNENFFHTLFQAISLGMFVFMPIVGFFLWVLFRHQRRFYYEHLIHSIHLHVVLFLLLLLLVASNAWLPDGTALQLAEALLGILLIAYPFLSIRRVYRQGLGKTVFKYLLLGASYGACLLLFCLAIVFVGIVSF